MIVAVLTDELFGRHVERRADDRARLSREVSDLRVLVAGRVGVAMREPEVENLHPSVTGDEQILRLQIAMDDPALVGGGEPSCDLAA